MAIMAMLAVLQKSRGLQNEMRLFAMKKFYHLLLVLLITAGIVPAAESVLKLGAGVGSPGSKDNIIAISLANLEPVKSMQVQITDMPNFLKPDSVWLTPRCAGFDVFYNDLDGSLNIILISTSQYIQPDTGAVIRISYSIMPAIDTLKQVNLLFSKTPTVVGRNYVVLPVQAINSQFMLSGSSAVEKRSSGPADFQLEQNYPNPFNPTTQIPFSINKYDWVSLAVFNSLGQHVRTLVNSRHLPGVYRVSWDGRDEHGNQVSGGLYLYRLVTGEQSKTKQMIYLR
jgi:hypothetical protein